MTVDARSAELSQRTEVLDWRGATGSLLNARWHRPPGLSAERPCPACAEPVVASDYVIRHGGELYHSDCAP